LKFVRNILKNVSESFFDEVYSPKLFPPKLLVINVFQYFENYLKTLK